jgi:SAM-dependent methyltransferase
VERADKAQIAFYLERAKAAGEAALELGCGTGVLAVALALAGVQVSAFDSSQARVAEARARRGALGLEPVRCAIERADLRGLRLGRRFPFVYLAANALLVQGGLDGALAVLATAREHLEPHGVFAFDVTPAPRLPGEARPRTPAEMRLFLSRRPHLAARSSRGRPASGHRFALLDLSPDEIDEALAHSGLAVLERWGGFAQQPYCPGSERLVVLAARADTPPASARR